MTKDDEATAGVTAPASTGDRYWYVTIAPTKGDTQVLAEAINELGDRFRGVEGVEFGWKRPS